MDDKFFYGLRKKIQPYFVTAGSHDFYHTERVYNFALKLSEGERIDLDVLKAAALLHDIARKMEDNKECQCHAETGAALAKKILEKSKFPKAKIPKVMHAIGVHRHSKGLRAGTREAEILQDADRLDALGAITIARMFSSGGEINRPMYLPKVPLGTKSKEYDSISTIHGFHNKILKITPDTFKTKKARKIAEERYRFVETFLNRFMKEWNGDL